MKEIEKTEIGLFSLCESFEKLSLKDNTAGSSSSSSTGLVQPSSYGSIDSMVRFMHICRQSTICKSIINRLRAPFIDFPSNYINSLSKATYDIHMCFGFRFLPGQSELLIKDLKLYTLTSSFERLTFLSNALGLSFFKKHLGSETGMRGIVTDGLNKILVEVSFITFVMGVS